MYGAVFLGNGRNGAQVVGQGYSNRTAAGTARGDDPQSMYAVLAGKHFNGGCCFDYGNAENATKDRARAGPMADGTMEAVYYGVGYRPTGPGSGSGPWVMADMENGIYAGPSSRATVPSVPVVDFVAAFVKGDTGNRFAVAAGDAQTPGSLKAVYDGPRPRGYEVMRKQGGIVLGVGGDNSPWAAGTFYEGVMTQGFASAATEAAVMANIVAAGYGHGR